MGHRKAKKLSEKAIIPEEQGDIETAIALYKEAIREDDCWATPYYNLGLIYKYKYDWQESYAFNKRAAELDPEHEAAWWNLGIAATALKDWRTARQAWNKFGLNFDVNDEVTDFDLGSIPIRLNPDTDGEVVWCKRIDPARAVIKNIPLSKSGHRFGDLVLNDGAPVGHRTSNGKEYPVFNELQLLTKSAHKTYSVTAVIESQAHIDTLESLCQGAEVEMEDWSTIKYLCRQCSEGTVHEHHDQDLEDRDNSERYIGFASQNVEKVKKVLTDWRAITLCEHSEIELELE